MVLSGRLALVTGGGSGIGRAVGQVLARDNAKVVVADLNVQNCKDTEQVHIHLFLKLLFIICQLIQF